jgi:hypothetical protein
MKKIKYIWAIVKDRWLKPYDEIILRFNTKAEPGDHLVWRIFVNGNQSLASDFEIYGYIYAVSSEYEGDTKYNVGCMGRVRWEGTKAIIIAARKQPQELL